MLTKEQGQLTVKILCDYSYDTTRCGIDDFHKVQDIVSSIMKETGAEWPYKDEVQNEVIP